MSMTYLHSLIKQQKNKMFLHLHTKHHNSVMCLYTLTEYYENNFLALIQVVTHYKARLTVAVESRDRAKFCVC